MDLDLEVVLHAVVYLVLSPEAEEDEQHECDTEDQGSQVVLLDSTGGNDLYRGVGLQVVRDHNILHLTEHSVGASLLDSFHEGVDHQHRVYRESFVETGRDSAGPGPGVGGDFPDERTPGVGEVGLGAIGVHELGHLVHLQSALAHRVEVLSCPRHQELVGHGHVLQLVVGTLSRSRTLPKSIHRHLYVPVLVYLDLQLGRHWLQKVLQQLLVGLDQIQGHFVHGLLLAYVSDYEASGVEVEVSGGNGLAEGVEIEAVLVEQECLAVPFQDVVEVSLALGDVQLETALLVSSA